MDENGRCIADKGGWTEALQYLRALQDAGAEWLPIAEYGNMEISFSSGQVAYAVGLPTQLMDFQRELGKNLRVAVLPAGPAGPARPMNNLKGFLLNPNSSHPQDAVDVALYLTTGERAQRFANEALQVPVNVSVTPGDPRVLVFAQASTSVFPRPQNAEFGNYGLPFARMFEAVFDEGADPYLAVADACAQMNEASGK
jgi:arabinogalactan oligomer / maltooligosaccharide transport system substrate-binding protein